MNRSERTLRRLLTIQGLFYLGVNVWALIATPHFLSWNNPTGDIFEARGFAALSLVVAVFLLAGAMRKDLLRPASFLGLGSAGAIVLVEAFHLYIIGQTLLWIDLVVELVLAGFYLYVFFFRRDEEPAPAEEAPKSDEAASEQPLEPIASELATPPLEEHPEADETDPLREI